MEQEQPDAVPADAAGTPKSDPPLKAAAAAHAEPDERPSVADRLNAQLDIGLALLEKCEMLAVKTPGDKLRPIHAATRLMQANTNAGRAITQLECNEASLKGIVQRLQNLSVPAPDAASAPGATPAVSVSRHYVDATCDILAYRLYQLASEREFWYEPPPPAAPAPAFSAPYVPSDPK